MILPVSLQEIVLFPVARSVCNSPFASERVCEWWNFPRARYTRVSWDRFLVSFSCHFLSLFFSSRWYAQRIFSPLPPLPSSVYLPICHPILALPWQDRFCLANEIGYSHSLFNTLICYLTVITVPYKKYNSIAICIYLYRNSMYIFIASLCLFIIYIFPICRDSAVIVVDAMIVVYLW